MNEMVSTLGDSLLFVSAGDSEVLVYDITAPDAPTLIGGHILPNDSASTWGVDVHDGTVVGSYINNHGLAQLIRDGERLAEQESQEKELKHSA